MSNGATYQDFSNYVSETAGQSATFLSEVFGKIQQGAIAESDRLAATADALAQDFQRFSETAARYADKAVQAGNTRAAEVFSKISQAHAQVAAERATSSAADYVGKVAQDAKAASSGLASKAGPMADAVQIGIGALEGFSTGDFSSLGRASSSAFYAGVFGAAAAAALGPGLLAGALVGAIALGAGLLGGWVWDNLFGDAQRSVPRRDPLTLDLDGDGLETVGFDPSHPVYFDHDLNGTKEGTGWVAPDDGFLVLDRNGNGVIDNGSELFGDHTPLAGGGTAADGFAALVQEDTNADGKVDALDARFADLRVWRDLNQDGISQAGELISLADANIAAINVAKTANNQTLANGNQIADLGTYIKTDGSTGGLGETHGLADINLAADTFHRQFTTTIPPTPETTALPDMRGSGAVRNLRIAADDNVWFKAA